jgi:hypothetical protein
MDNEYKLKLNVRIAMLYLEDEDSVNAEMFIKKASSLVTSVKVYARPMPWYRNEVGTTLVPCTMPSHPQALFNDWLITQFFFLVPNMHW